MIRRTTPPAGRRSPDPAWPSLWTRAALEPALLGALTAGPLHGYGIAQMLAGRGFGSLRGGSLYPVLARLEEAGLITSRWVEGDAAPGRKDYALTDAGRAEHRRAAASFRALADVLVDLGRPDPEMPADRVGTDADPAEVLR